MIVRDAVDTVRSMMTGALIDEISVLAQPYDPATDSVIHLKYPRRTLMPGSVLCVGLNTFVAMSVSGDGETVEIIPSMDGGPNVAAAENEIVRIKPQFTTWAIVRELQSEIDAMSSPDVGLYQPIPMTTANNPTFYSNGVFAVPPLADGRIPVRLLRAEHRPLMGTDQWVAFTECEYRIEDATVRVFWRDWTNTDLRFTFAYTFGGPIASLDDNLEDFGIWNQIADIPILGAALVMALGWEGRRVQPFSQGDSRRAGEVVAGANSSLARQFAARKQQRINEESARLIQLFGYRLGATTGPTTIPWGVRG